MVSLAMYQDLLGKYDALVREVVAMKRDGFVPSVPEGVVATLPTLPAKVQAAIHELVTAAGGDVDFSRTLTATAWELVRSGLPEDEVAALVAKGEEVPA